VSISVGKIATTDLIGRVDQVFNQLDSLKNNEGNKTVQMKKII
jgi:hypothetical protein